ncbi:MAG: hypothetical protein WKF96_22325 [Solirubrobacteraceae bacterium]
MSAGGEHEEPATMADRPWRRLAEWTDVYAGARESLRWASEQAREREAETDLWELVRADSRAGVRERAALMLWALLGRQGRDPELELELREALLDKPGREFPEIWGGAWYGLGHFLILLGEAEAAEVPMRRAISCGHPDVVDQAQCNLGIALSSVEGRERDAEVLLREVATTGYEPFASIARHELSRDRSNGGSTGTP